MIGRFSAEDPCIAPMKGVFGILRNETLIAVDRDGEILVQLDPQQKQTRMQFTPFQWSNSVHKLGKNNYHF